MMAGQPGERGPGTMTYGELAVIATQLCINRSADYRLGVVELLVDAFAFPGDERFREQRKRECAQDLHLAPGAIGDTIADVRRDLTALLEADDNLTTEVGDLRSEIADVRSELEDTQRDLENDIASLRDDVDRLDRLAD